MSRWRVTINWRSRLVEKILLSSEIYSITAREIIRESSRCCLVERKRQPRRPADGKAAVMRKIRRSRREAAASQKRQSATFALWSGRKRQWRRSLVVLDVAQISSVPPRRDFRADSTNSRKPALIRRSLARH